MRFAACLGLLIALAGLSSCQQPAAAHRARPQDELLILVSIDGFRWDYLDRYDVPTLRQLAREGVHAQRMTPCFPSKTFPNHYTLVTGLRPESHGIVSNWFWDPAYAETFGMSKPDSNAESRWWDEGEPVWITAEKQGVRSACYFWPGSETEIRGVRPTLFQKFNGRLRSDARVDGLLAWLDRPAAQRPRFCTLYFDLVDHAGHTFGPESPETAAAAHEADAAIARLLAGLAARGLREKTNLVIVSDHGMSECGPDRVVFIEDLMDPTKVRVESTGPNGGVRPLPGTVTAAALAASIRAKAPPQLHVYLREEMPERFHYRRNPRIPDVMLVMDDHWSIESKVGWPSRRATYVKGSHGWDPALPNMGALFLAQGPAFRRGHEFADVENIHVYNLLCAVLGITPARNEGDDRLVREALAP
ncbi:ectonucleotide pyrophosphatase/phosphodiesterase [Oleiharenicola sp. Vm1]|uniref:alkaline phosphatase family protein n=1 Tax=Oleiharenicola sp. Vm1 TaxID=3398393 RepID=UPI0039F5D249